jgi:predicted ATP-binding protein involved in virulence
MATENPRVWFKSISLENVRSFGPKQTIYFTEDGTENGNVARWNVILGDNGMGKTTVLKAVCLLCGENSSDRIEPMLRNSNININLEGKAQISAEEVELVGKINVRRTSFLSGSLIITSDMVNNLAVLGDNFLLFAYGAARKPGGGQLEAKRPTDNLFDENSTLSSAESWLLEAELTSLKEANNNHYETVVNVLNRLFLNEIDDIYSQQTSINKGVQAIALTKFGEVPLSELSLGYRTLIAWVIDLAKRLFSLFPESPNPLAEPAVCLVDELDLHLHPRFQQTIISFLTNTFKNTQFIVTAHSPLIVQAAEDEGANVILLKREGDHTVVVNKPVDVWNWRVDQILTSELFGLKSPRSKKVQKLQNQRDKLLSKRNLTNADHNKIEELEHKIGHPPFGEEPEEIEAETIIRHLAEVLRNRVGSK